MCINKINFLNYKYCTYEIKLLLSNSKREWKGEEKDQLPDLLLSLVCPPSPTKENLPDCVTGSFENDVVITCWDIILL